jgi:hypothetical protein
MAGNAKDGALAGAADCIAKLQTLGALDNGKIALGAVRAGMNATLKIAQTKIPVGHRVHKTYKGRVVAPGFGKSTLRIVATTKTDDGLPAALLSVGKEAYYETQFLEWGTKKIRGTHWLLQSFQQAQDSMKQGTVAYLQNQILKLAAAKP